MTEAETEPPATELPTEAPETEPPATEPPTEAPAAPPETEPETESPCRLIVEQITVNLSGGEKIYDGTGRIPLSVKTSVLDGLFSPLGGDHTPYTLFNVLFRFEHVLIFYINPLIL